MLLLPPFRSLRAVAAAFCALAHGFAQPAEIDFQFNPPDGAVYEQTSVRTRKLEMASGRRTDVSETKARNTITKAEDGFAIKSKFLHSTISRNGQPIANPISTAMEGLEVTLHVGPDGRLREIEGFRGVLDAIKAKFPGPIAQMMIPLFNEQSLIQRERAEWEGRYGGFAGKTARIGDVWTAEDEYDLPNGGKTKFYSATVFDSLVDCGGKKCVRVKFAYNSSSEDLAELVGKVVGDLAKSTGSDPAVVQLSSGIEITGSGERIVDPETMIIHSEKIERTIKLEIDAGSGPQPATVHETREFKTTKIKS